MTRVLVLCPDTTGPSMAGPAIRSVEIARTLAAEHVVTLGVPDGSTRVAVDVAQVRVPSEATLPTLVADADCVVISGRAELMTAVRKPLVVDLYDPFILSDLEFYGGRADAGSGRPLLALRWLQHHLENGDLFLCASEAQRSFWLGMLAAAGRVNRANHAGDRTFDELLAIVPFGMAATPPVRTAPAVKGVIPGIGAADRVVLWAGGLWNWLDPLTLLDALARLRQRRPDVKALFLGVRHPNAAIGVMAMAERARARARDLGLLDRTAFFLDWVPYAERQNYLLDADVAVSLHQPGVEAQFAFRTRVLDYLWGDLPMVLSRGDELAARVERAGLGIAVPAGDADAVAGALALLLDGAPSATRAARAAALREELAWPRVLAPLARFCRAPRLAPDKHGAAWFDPTAPPSTLLHKEDALIGEEWVNAERTLTPTLGRRIPLTHRFVAAYDNLCRVDVLPWIAATPPAADLVFTLHEEGAGAARVARVVTPLRSVPHDGWQRFEFRPVANSRGHAYRLTLATPTVDDAGVAFWLCTGADPEEPTPALAVHYLVKGVVEALPFADESFLFLHNTTVSDALVPGTSALAEGHDDVASSLSAAPTASDDALRADVARLATELGVTRRELATLAARTNATAAPTPALPQLGRELADVLGRVAHRLRTGGGLVLAAVLTILSIPLALAVAVARAGADAWTRTDRQHGAEAARAAEAAAAQTAEALFAAAEAPLARPRSTLPISIVIPSWNGQALLATSLPAVGRALAAYPPGGEILVVDDGSDDETQAWIAAEHPDVRVVAIARNAGFAPAANHGVRAARHPTLVLLNNDMLVEPDFLLPLVHAMDAEPSAFGVSCQIDFLDPAKPRWETGKVHARWKWGTITLFHVDHWQDDGHSPVFFAGGGASAYDRAKFLALGGFDAAVCAPIYIEDVELGYRAWKRGWPSLFAPQSRVHHRHRATTRRKWTEDEIYAFFVKNLAALVWKNVDDPGAWWAHLGGLMLLPFRVRSQAGIRAALHTWIGLCRQLPAVTRARARERALPRRFDDATIFHVSRHRHALRAYLGRRPARAAGARLRLLIASPYSPYPPLHGGAVRMLALLRRLSAVADVTWVAYVDTPPELDPRSLAALQKLCRQVVLIERDKTAVGGPLFPDRTRGFCSPRMAQQIADLLEREDFDVLQIEYTHLAHLMPPPTPGMLRVLVEHEVSFVSLARNLRRTRSGLARAAQASDWMRTLRYELAAVERADLVLTMSETDRARLDRYVDTTHVVPIPNGVDGTAFPFAPAAGRKPATILFVGFFRHDPNVEAVCWFVRDVLPRVRAALPDACFRVVGAYPPEAVYRLGDDPAVEVTGRVGEIAPFYRDAGVFVAPVLRGSGTRLKILEAMASGCPVVSTTIGAEGLGVTHERELLIADEPEAMADAIGRLRRDPVLGATLAARARRFVEEHYEWDAIAARLVAAYEAGLESLAPRPILGYRAIPRGTARTRAEESTLNGEGRHEAADGTPEHGRVVADGAPQTVPSSSPGEIR